MIPFSNGLQVASSDCSRKDMLVGYNCLQQEVSMDYSGQNSHLWSCHCFARNVID